MQRSPIVAAPFSTLLIAVLPFAVLTSCATTDVHDLDPPSARVRPYVLTAHDDVRVDDYYWLNQREDPEVIAYLEAENAYTEAVTAHLAGLRDELYDEIVARISPDDVSVPYEEDGYWYATRYEEGGEYPIYTRRKGAPDGPEQVLLDGPRLAEGHAYFAIGGFQVTTDGHTLAYAFDTVGRRKYDVRFNDLIGRRAYAEVLEDVTGNMAWAADGRTLFYARQDPQTLRSYQIWRHVLGTDPSQDELVYQEDDEEFRCFVSLTKSKRYLLIGSSQTLSSEYHYLDASDPRGAFQVVLPRERNHRYSVEHFGDHFYLLTNDSAKNRRLVRTPIGSHDRSAWGEVVPHDPDVLLEGTEFFSGHLVLRERAEGLTRIRVREWATGAEHLVDFGEPAYAAALSNNRTFETTTLRYVYSSLTTPRSDYDYDLVTRERVLLKRDQVLPTERWGAFDPADYVTERLWVAARDGERVPISLVHRRDVPRDGTQPLLLSAYGSYGSSRDATFSSARLSLLDRGFIYAIAHVRGGREMGERWYDDGKLFNKKNTFTDFIDCAVYLTSSGYTSTDRLFAQGGSAGGLLMGAICNMRPDLFRGVVANVPFVDVVTTMLDDTIPLTTFEYDEWGNPNERAAYEYMLSYSPYDQVSEQAYPALLVTTGLHDSQVQYWEPAKWVAKLRVMNTGDQPLLLRTDMAAGHGGASGRFKRFEETAFTYAFLLDLVGVER
jgi:oligopeptidase B